MPAKRKLTVEGDTAEVYFTKDTRVAGKVVKAGSKKVLDVADANLIVGGNRGVDATDAAQVKTAKADVGARKAAKELRNRAVTGEGLANRGADTGDPKPVLGGAT